MDSRLLLSLPQTDLSPLTVFHAARRTCRAAVRQRPSLGAALLFSGEGLLVLLEGRPDDLLACADSIVTTAGPLPFDSWRQAIEPGEDRHLPAGTCQVGYVDTDQRADQRNEAVQAAGGDVASRIQAFMRLLAASDHD